jgi:simple sugar transport system substrate-binding protein
MDQSGKMLLKAGETADDKFLHGINFYVKGVKGKPPAGK